MLRLLTPILLAALLSVALTAQAEDRNPNLLYINPSLGFKDFGDGRDLSNSDIFQLGLEYRFHDNWSVETVYGEGDLDRVGAPGESDYDDYRLDGLYYFQSPREEYQPYLAIGGGYTEFDANAEGRANLGGGIRIRVTDWFSLRADLREFISPGEGEFDTMGSLGFSLALGDEGGSARPVAATPADDDRDGVPNSADQCPTTPAGVAVDARGCERDSDGDGVVDSRDQCPATPRGRQVNKDGCEPDSDGDGIVDSRDQCPNSRPGATVNKQGCEPKAPEQRVIELQIQFPTDSAEIAPRYDSEIRQVAEVLGQYPDITVEIAGHTDDRGSAGYNRQLSQRRADAVRQRLIERFGIAPERVSARGYGEAEPLASNDTAEGRRRNRRVEARIEYTVKQ